MKTKTPKYYSGATELRGVWPEKRDIVRARFPAGTLRKHDDFSLLVGSVSGKVEGNWLPVTRVILYNEHGTKHACDSRCQGAKGRNCECSCGGDNHGIQL